MPVTSLPSLPSEGLSRTPVAGVHPSKEREATVMTVWPSVSAGPWGRWLGRLYGLRAGFEISGMPLTLGWLLVVVTAPLAGLFYFSSKAPRKPFLLFGPVNPDCLAYRLTTRRVLIEHPLESSLEPVDQIDLVGFDEIRIEILPGQAWFNAGEVLFLRSGDELLRLSGVSRPEPFVRTVEKARIARISSLA